MLSNGTPSIRDELGEARLVPLPEFIVPITSSTLPSAAR